MSIFVVSAPSGTGKTTLNRRLVANHPEIEMSVSHTTRGPRPGEVDQVHYHFIDKQQFSKMIEGEEFVEWAEVHGNFYGTSKAALNQLLERGLKPILEIDVQGWITASKHLENTVSIFILPPSLRSLWDRLENRGSDSLDVRWVRLKNAYNEIKQADKYQHFVINGDLESAYQSLKSLVVDDQANAEEDLHGKNLCLALNEEYQNAEWINELRQRLG